MISVTIDELSKRFNEEGGSLATLMREAAGVANAIHSGAGEHIAGSLMEADFRRALKLRKGEVVTVSAGEKHGS